MLVDLRLEIDPVLLHEQRLLLCYLAVHDKSGVVEGLQNLCDAIADRLADYNGDMRALLSGDAEEHARGRRMVRDLMQEDTVDASD
jgi:hypothetical protein